jgi:hypothetical protein
LTGEGDREERKTKKRYIFIYRIGIIIKFIPNVKIVIVSSFGT